MLIKGRHTDSVYCLAELVSGSCLEKEVPSFSFVQRCHWVGRKRLVDKEISSALGVRAEPGVPGGPGWVTSDCEQSYAFISELYKYFLCVHDIKKIGQF